MDTWRLFHYESFRRISRRRSVFSMVNTWEISSLLPPSLPPFIPFPLCAKNIRSVEKAHRNPSNFLLIQQQRKVTALSTWGARSSLSPCQENKGEMQSHVPWKPRNVPLSSPSTKPYDMGLLCSLPRNAQWKQNLSS